MIYGWNPRSTAEAAPEPSFAAAEKSEYVALYNGNSAGTGLPADRYTLTSIPFPNGSTYQYYVEDGYNVIGAPSHRYTLLSANDRVFTIVPHLDLSEELNSTSSIILSTDQSTNLHESINSVDPGVYVAATNSGSTLADYGFQYVIYEKGK